MSTPMWRISITNNCIELQEKSTYLCLYDIILYVHVYNITDTISYIIYNKVAIF